MLIIDIIRTIIVPIFIIIGIGVLLDRFFDIDLPTLSKLNFYVFVPALIFVKILDSTLSVKEMRSIVIFSVTLVFVLFVLSLFVFRLKPYRDRQTILSMGTFFFNSGNFGIPFVVLAFGNRHISTIAMILMVQNFLNFTLGIWLLEKDGEGTGPVKIMVRFLKVPAILSIILALILRSLDLELIATLKEPLNYLGNGLIPIALLTLGVQLARARLGSNLVPLSGSVLMRLVISPLVAWALIPIFGITGELATVLIVTAGLPVAVNTYILAAEYGKDEELASQQVFWTTLLSTLTLAILIAVFR